MIKDIIKYPASLSVQYGVDVRNFDEELFALIDDLKDTITENNLDGLCAYQIGSYFNVIVIKNDNGDFVEFINPRMISHDTKITGVETTTYYAEMSATVSRYENISLVYQDREAQNHSFKASGALAVLIQRKLDYTFGATFIQKLSDTEREIFEKKLQSGSNTGFSDYCPTTFKRDKILKVINISMIFMALAVVVSLFMSDTENLSSLWEYQLYAFYSLLILNVVYFLYAQYEGKLYTSCSSCQLGNIIGTTVISLIKLSLIMLASYFIINPS